ncbi:MAG: cupin domain-containing protein [Pseudomonadota bacterium]
MDKGSESQVHLAGLLGGGWAGFSFETFRDGVDICWIRRADPSVALLRYAPGSRVPRHLHTGLETIFILQGSQSDESGTYAAGSVVLNPAGSIHSVWSDQGCVLMIEWEKPVQILDEPQA